MSRQLFTKRNNHKSEELFHDEWAKSTHLEKVDPVAQFEGPTSPEYRFAASLLQPVRGKKILVLGCGLGEEAVYLALQGANVTAIDISQEMLTFTKQLALHYHVRNRIRLIHVAAEKIDFKKELFDAVFACNLLHHTIVKQVIKRISLVLKPKGICVFLEPLAYNPIINIYRQIASEVRTDEEHPIVFSDLDSIKEYFPHLEHREFHLFTLFIFVWFYFGERVNPNQERYWKKIIYDSYRYNSSFLFLRKLDLFFQKYFPFLDRYCWVTVIRASMS